MAKYTHPDVLDGALDVIRNNCNQITICSQQPTTRAEAVSTYALGSVSANSGDFTKGNGTVSGRKLTVAAKSFNITTNGNMTHIALVDGTRLLHVTTCSITAVVSGQVITVPAWEAEFSSPF